MTSLLTNTVIRGDCLDVMPTLPAGCARLIFADPPYNLGVDYGDGKKADRLPRYKYHEWTRHWMIQCVDLLAPDGSFWVMICDEWAAQFAILLEGLGLHRRNWIIWYETFGPNCTRKFNRCKRHILYSVQDPKRFVFNPKAVNRPSDRQTKYGDTRANPDGKNLDDVWQVSRLCGTFGERIHGAPTQVPLEIMRRIIGCATDPGDLVLDPFAGSGTTLVAAAKLGRQYIGIESQEKFCKMARKRLA